MKKKNISPCTHLGKGRPVGSPPPLSDCHPVSLCSGHRARPGLKPLGKLGSLRSCSSVALGTQLEGTVSMWPASLSLLYFCWEIGVQPGLL